MSILKDEEPPLFKSSDFTFAKRKIEENENIKKSDNIKFSIPMKITRYLSRQKGINDMIEVVNALTSFTLVVLFAANNYHD